MEKNVKTKESKIEDKPKGHCKELNQPNYKLMAKAFLYLYKQPNISDTETVDK